MIFKVQKTRLALLLPLTLLGIMSLSALVGAQQAGPKEGKAPSRREETAGQKYKNVKVLRDLPAKQLIPMMHTFNKELSVTCEFCHVVNAEHNAWDKDDNPNKEVSRDMIRIVQDLNAPKSATGGTRSYHLKTKANCFLCHHGHPEAITTTPLE